MQGKSNRIDDEKQKEGKLNAKKKKEKSICKQSTSRANISRANTSAKYKIQNIRVSSF
jgi:hypothetical protein